METIISNFKKKSRHYNYIKLGFISKIIDCKDDLDGSSQLSQSELELYHEYSLKIKSYEDSIGTLMTNLKGKRIIDISHYFFEESSLSLDQEEYVLEIVLVRDYFIAGYIGALIYLQSTLLNNSKIQDSINSILKNNHRVVNPIAKDRGIGTLSDLLGKPDNFILNWHSFVDFLTNRRITSLNNFLLALDELLAIQDNINFIPEHKIITNQLKDIKDSVNYAARIQNSLLPIIDRVKNRVRGYNVYYKPKDIISGDFYFFKELNDTYIFGCGDCTGHGIPGALLTVLSINIIEQILEKSNKKNLSPSFLMSQLDSSLTNALNRNSKNNSNNLLDNLLLDKYNPTETVSVVNDGLDLAICFVNKNTKELTFSGAGLTLFKINSNEVDEIKTRENKGLGGLFDFKKTFIEKKFILKKDDIIILTTDGIVDQFGGENGKKLMKKRFKEIIKIIGKDSLISSLSWRFFLDSWLNGSSYENIISDLSSNSDNFRNIYNFNYQEQIDDITIVTFQI